MLAIFKFLSGPSGTTPTKTEIKELVRSATVSGIAQIIIQALSIVTAILIIRVLSASEYAWYTLANTMLATIVTIADGGMSAAVLSEGGKVWNHNQKLSAVMTTAISLRRNFAAAVLLVAFPILIFILNSHGASWPYSILLSVSLIPVFLSTLNGHILEIVPKLRQKIITLQKIQMHAAIAKLLLLSGVIFIAPFTYLLVVISGIPQIWANDKIRKANRISLGTPQNVQTDISKAILKKVKRSFPTVLYFAFSGQITIWLAAAFGSTLAVAELGAISRLGILLTFFSSMFTLIVIPRFARLQDNRRIIQLQFRRIISAFSVVLVLVVGMVYLFPSQILWILGSNYSGLQLELLLIIFGAAINLLAGSIINMNVSRGWILKPSVTILVNITTLLLGIFIFDFSDLVGILWFSIFQSGIGLIIHFLYSLHCINRI